MSVLPDNIRVVDLMNFGQHGGNVISPTLINGYSAMSVPAWRRAIVFLSENLASFPRSVHRDGARADDNPHSLTRLLNRRPNALQNPTILWRTWYAHAAATGNGYLRIERDASGRSTALHNLLPGDVVAFRLEHDGVVGQYYFLRSTRAVLPGADVLHLQAGLSYDGLAGVDPVSQHEATFQHAATLNKYQTQYLMKGTAIRGAVEFPNAMQSEERDEIAAYIKRYFYGPDSEKDVIILTHGGKLNNTTISPEESQIVQQGAAVTKQIAQITGVPPAFLFELSEEKYRSTIEQDGLNLVRFTFRPWIEQAEDELTMKLLSREEQDTGLTVHINPDALLRGDTAAVNQSAISTKTAGIRTANEARALLSLSKLSDPEADKLATLGSSTAMLAPSAEGGGRPA